MRLRLLVDRRLRAQKGQNRDDVFIAEILELQNRHGHAAIVPDAVTQYTDDGAVRSGPESGLAIRGQIRGEDRAKGQWELVVASERWHLSTRQPRPIRFRPMTIRARCRTVDKIAAALDDG